jgi:hypothetical protein
MLTVLKTNGGANSTVGSETKRGRKGRLELFAERTAVGGVGIKFVDYGNYGRVRWEADFGELDEFELNAMIDSLKEVLAGASESSRIPFAEDQGQVSEAVQEEHSSSEILLDD